MELAYPGLFPAGQPFEPGRIGKAIDSTANQPVQSAVFDVVGYSEGADFTNPIDLVLDRFSVQIDGN